MINTKRLIWAIGKTEKIHIKNIDSGKRFETKTFKYDRNKKIFIFENIVEGTGNIEIRRNKIKMLSRIESVPDKFLFYIETYDNKRYELELFMKEGFTPFCCTSYEKKNVKNVASTIPKYLNNFKDKTVVVIRASANAVFSTWNIEDCNESHIVSDCYIFDSFNYDAEIVDGIIVLKLFDNSNSKIYTTGLNVTFIIADKNKAIFGAKNGEYTLKILE